jgi:hypothetical protein
MNRIAGILILGLCIEFLAAPEATFGQLRGSLGSGVRGGYGGTRGGIRRGVSRSRSGLGFQNNPIANPAPSLTPHQIFNPRGSISAGQVLNPAPSLSRPRAGVSPSAVNRTDQFRRAQTGSVRNTPVNRAVASSPAVDRVQKLAAAIEQQLQRQTPVRERKRLELAFRLALLEQELRTYPNGDRWVRYLDLPAAETFDTRGEGDHSSGQQLQIMLARFEKVTGNSEYEKVSSLPAYQSAHSVLASFIKGNSEDDPVGDSAERNPKPQAASGK